MVTGELIGLVRVVCTARDRGDSCGRDELATAIGGITRIRGVLDGIEAELVTWLSEVAACPEATVAARAAAHADTTRAGTGSTDTTSDDGTGRAGSTDCAGETSTAAPTASATTAPVAPTVPARRPPRAMPAEVLVVIDADHHDDRRTLADLGIPINVSLAALRELCANALIRPILIRDNYIIGGLTHLNRGRTTRLATHEPRLALRNPRPLTPTPDPPPPRGDHHASHDRTRPTTERARQPNAGTPRPTRPRANPRARPSSCCRAIRCHGV